MHCDKINWARNFGLWSIKHMSVNDKSAFIAIIGRPNVGKSSILNRILGQKVAIVSSKPQTTRTRIMGVLTEGETQLVFIDTPGMHKPKNELGKYMVKSVDDSVAGVDAAMLVAECDKVPGDIELKLIEKTGKLKIPIILALNKIDILKRKEDVIPVISSYSSVCKFSAVVPVSAKNGSGLDELKSELKSLAIEGGHLFDGDTLTDQPERVLVAEIIREKLLMFLDKEIPHGTAVVVERMKSRDNSSNMLDIDATIYCERNSHKGIIIGKGGCMLKKIGSYARQDMERFFACKINLKIWVKVREDWRNRENILRSLGFNS